MIARIKISPFGGGVSNLNDPQWARLRSVLTDLPEEKPKDVYSLFMNERLLELETAGPVLAELGIELTLVGFEKNTMLVRMDDRVRELESKMALVKTDVELYEKGAILQLHVPNIGLLAMNEMDVLEDICTDDLQAKLDEGWRVVAVCPPNAQRRPDYIIGRHNPTREPGARRAR